MVDQTHPTPSEPHQGPITADSPGKKSGLPPCPPRPASDKALEEARNAAAEHYYEELVGAEPCGATRYAREDFRSGWDACLAFLRSDEYARASVAQLMEESQRRLREKIDGLAGSRTFEAYTEKDGVLTPVATFRLASSSRAYEYAREEHGADVVYDEILGEWINLHTGEEVDGWTMRQEGGRRA